MKKMILRWSLFFLTLCTMIMIFCFSSESGEESAAASDGIMALLIRGFSGKEMNELSEKELGTISLIIRKLAHFSEFFLLGAFSGGFIRTYNMKPFVLHFHQHFALSMRPLMSFISFLFREETEARLM